MNTVSIFIIDADHSPVRLHAENVSAVLPIGRDVELDERLMPLLRDSVGIQWRYTGQATPEANERHEGVGEGFDATEIITGTVGEVAARLSALTAEQLLSVRAAEEGRDGDTRKGVLTAINRAIEALNEDHPQ